MCYRSCVTWCRWQLRSVSTCQRWRRRRSQLTDISPSFTHCARASRRAVVWSSSALCGQPQWPWRCRWPYIRTSSSPSSMAPSYALALKTGHTTLTPGDSSLSAGRLVRCTVLLQMRIEHKLNRILSKRTKLWFPLPRCLKCQIGSSVCNAFVFSVRAGIVRSSSRRRRSYGTCSGEAQGLKNRQRRVGFVGSEGDTRTSYTGWIHWKRGRYQSQLHEVCWIRWKGGRYQNQLHEVCRIRGKGGRYQNQLHEVGGRVLEESGALP